MAIRQESDADRCTICGNFEDDHPYRHAFTLVTGDLREKPAEPKRREPPTVVSTDIALRLALIEKGVLTTDDILAAEQKLGLRPGVAQSGQSPEEAQGGGDHG